MVTVIATGGGFDPIHKGHLKLLKKASELGDHLQVWLTSDEWLLRKKGYVLLPYEHRKAVLEALPWVDEVVPQIDEEGLSCEKSIRAYRPNILAKGGLYHQDNLPRNELNACIDVACHIVYGVGGHIKEGSSSDFFEKAVVQYIKTNGVAV